MKKLYTLVLLSAFAASLFAQELDSLQNIMDKKDAPASTENRVEIEDDGDGFTPVIVDEDSSGVNIRLLDKDVVKVIEDGDTTYVRLGEKGVIQVSNQPDSTTIRVGDKEIRIVERDDDTDVIIDDTDENDFDDILNPKFRGHWAGMEWGINNFLDDDFSISREGDNQFLDLNTGRSWAINLNFAQYSIGFGTSHAGLVTGLGLEFNNYFFDHDNSIKEVDDYVVADTLSGNIAKSKLTATYLRVPLIFEVQFPGTIRAQRIHMSAGIIASLKLGSHTKVVYKDSNGKDRDKKNDDFNINPFRYGLTARVGFGGMSIFGEYYFSTLFVKDKGPELHPFTVGLAMAF